MYEIEICMFVLILVLQRDFGLQSLDGWPRQDFLFHSDSFIIYLLNADGWNLKNSLLDFFRDYIFSKLLHLHIATAILLHANTISISVLVKNQSVVPELVTFLIFFSSLDERQEVIYISRTVYLHMWRTLLLVQLTPDVWCLVFPVKRQSPSCSLHFHFSQRKKKNNVPQSYAWGTVYHPAVGFNFHI